MNTPNNPTKAPSIPTGPRANAKTSNSKVMSPMKKAGKTVPTGGKVRGATGVNPKSQGATVDGSPRR